MTGTPSGVELQEHLQILERGLQPRATRPAKVVVIGAGMDAIVAREGRIHFAGEHASLSHAWIQGAIESGVRAASEIHDRTLAIA